MSTPSMDPQMARPRRAHREVSAIWRRTLAHRRAGGGLQRTGGSPAAHNLDRLPRRRSQTSREPTAYRFPGMVAGKRRRLAASSTTRAVMGSSSHLQRIEPSALPAMYSPAAETHRLPNHQGTAGAQRLHRTRMRVVRCARFPRQGGATQHTLWDRTTTGWRSAAARLARRAERINTYRTPLFPSRPVARC
jgi:hypothetical protein